MQKHLWEAIETLRTGGTVLHPTDTVWGIGCDATSPQAIERLNKIKNRKKGQPLIILVSDLAMLMKYVETVPYLVLDYFKENKHPTTVIYPNPKNLPDNLLAEDGSIGIRIIKKCFTQMLIHRFEKPLVSTSANISGQPTPASFDEISREMIARVDYVIPEREEKFSNKPSTILKIEGERLIKIR